MGLKRATDADDSSRAGRCLPRPPLEGILNKIISAAVFRRELTKREIDVLTLVAQGYQNREIAKQLGVAVKTVENHRVNIMNKRGLRNTVQMIRYEIEKGIVPIEDR